MPLLCVLWPRSFLLLCPVAWSFLSGSNNTGHVAADPPCFCIHKCVIWGLNIEELRWSVVCEWHSDLSSEKDSIYYVFCNNYSHSSHSSAVTIHSEAQWHSDWCIWCLIIDIRSAASCLFFLVWVNMLIPLIWRGLCVSEDLDNCLFLSQFKDNKHTFVCTVVENVNWTCCLLKTGIFPCQLFYNYLPSPFCGATFFSLNLITVFPVLHW